MKSPRLEHPTSLLIAKGIIAVCWTVCVSTYDYTMYFFKCLWHQLSSELQITLHNGLGDYWKYTQRRLYFLYFPCLIQSKRVTHICVIEVYHYFRCQAITGTKYTASEPKKTTSIGAVLWSYKAFVSWINKSKRLYIACGVELFV